MLWWLYDQFKIVVGTRTIRRVFERKGDKVKGKSSSGSRPSAQGINNMEEHDDEDEESSPMPGNPYQSPYAPMQQTAQSAEQQLAQALQQQTPQTPYPALANVSMDNDLPEDEETIQLQLQQIALQKREVELKLKMRRIQHGKGTPGGRKNVTPQHATATSTLFDPQVAAAPQPNKRDSRSKKKIEESKKRTAERQERMLRELERRSRRRDHLTAEWVQSKDIWPLRAQGMLADLMHQYGTYAYSQQNEQTFDVMYRDLYQLVDLSKGDWVPQVHDEMLRERMKRKMGQLRTKMQKTGEIVGRGDAYGGWQKAENYTGEAAGAVVGDESEMQNDMQQQAQPGAAQTTSHGMQQDEPQQLQQHQHTPMQYELPPDHHHQQQAMHHQHTDMSYGAPPQMMQHQQQPSQYPMMPQTHHPGLLPYGNMDGSHQAGMGHQQGGMVM